MTMIPLNMTVTSATASASSESYLSGVTFVLTVIAVSTDILILIAIGWEIIGEPRFLD